MEAIFSSPPYVKNAILNVKGRLIFMIFTWLSDCLYLIKFNGLTGITKTNISLFRMIILSISHNHPQMMIVDYSLQIVEINKTAVNVESIPNEPNIAFHVMYNGMWWHRLNVNRASTTRIPWVKATYFTVVWRLTFVPKEIRHVITVTRYLFPLLFVCLGPPHPLHSKEKFTNKLAAVEIQWPVPTLKKYSPGRLKVDKYHISIQVMQPWVLHVFNNDIIYRSGERYWCNISWLWKNEEKQINSCGDSRPPAMRETFRAGYFHSCDWLSDLSEKTGKKFNYLHSNTLNTLFCANNNFPM